MTADADRSAAWNVEAEASKRGVGSAGVEHGELIVKDQRSMELDRNLIAAGMCPVQEPQLQREAA